MARVFKLPRWMAKTKAGKCLRVPCKLDCPQCGHEASYVLESRTHPDGVYRRRICPEGHRYSTLEVVHNFR